MEPEIIVNHIANSALAGQEQHFTQNLVTVGRDTGTDIAFDPVEDMVVSHRHAELYVEDGKLHLRDLQSRNGTYVNQKRITEPVELHPDDAIHFGYGGPSAKARLDIPLSATVDIRQTLFARLLPRKTRPPEPRPSEPRLSEPRLPPRREPQAEAAMVDTSRGQPPARTPEAPPPAVPAPSAAGTSWLSRVVFLFVALALGVGGAVAYHHYLQPLLAKHTESTPAPAVVSSAASGATAVASLGRLEPAGGVFEVGAPAGSTLGSVLVKEGQTVHSNDPLAHLSNYKTIQAEHAAAQTALEEATAQLQSVKKYAAATVEEARAAVQQTGKPLDLEVEALDAQIEWLKQHFAVATEDRKQLEALNQADLATQLTRQKMVEQAAQRELTATEKKLEQLRESVPLRRAQAEAQLQTAIANQARLEQSISVKTAEKNVERAAAMLAQAVLRAPCEGKVLKVNFREGASLNGRPVILLGDTRHMDVIAEVYETDIRHVAKGQRAVVTTPAISDRLRGEVTEVLWTVDRNSTRDLNPTAPEDRRIVAVRIRLSDEDVIKQAALLERLINLQVHVRIAGD